MLYNNIQVICNYTCDIILTGYIPCFFDCSTLKPYNDHSHNCFRKLLLCEPKSFHTKAK